MKHNIPIILILVGMFLVTQIIGLTIISAYHKEGSSLPYKIEKPQFERSTSYLPLMVIILVATGLAFVLVKFQLFRLWKSWFFLSVFFCLLIAFGAFFNQWVAAFLALVLALLKFFYRNVISHNISELFIYGGLAAIFVDSFTLLSAIILLILISIYDGIAVWKTKHMVKLAKAQSKMKIFAGFLVPYKKRAAILGGGDVGFTLLFAGVVLSYYGILNALVVVLFTATALTLLFIHGDNKKYYPAMPFLSAGCLLGLGFSLLI